MNIEEVLCEEIHCQFMDWLDSVGAPCSVAIQGVQLGDAKTMARGGLFGTAGIVDMGVLSTIDIAGDRSATVWLSLDYQRFIVLIRPDH